MLSSIQTLPVEVVHLIAAGEVIDSLSAVVRELVENSLDAGATRIVVAIWPQQWRVRVADNGCGMKIDDLQQAATPHSTSKISTCEDLWRIESLGFRGEALHSITQLAELEIISRYGSANDGWCVVYGAGGNPQKVKTAAIAPGTVVTVANLFANWLNHRQGLPSPAQQMKVVQKTIYQIALCHPHVTWQIWQDDREWFSLSPGETTQQLIPQILRQVHVSDLQYLKIDIAASNDQLNLVLGLPDRCHRHRPDWVRVAVNGRIVKLAEIEQTVLAATARTLPRDRYPVCFLHMHIAPHQINWNRHPAKTEIYLHQLTYWQEQVTQAITQALQINAANLPEAQHNTRVSKLIAAAEVKGGYSASRAIEAPSLPSTAKDAYFSPLSPYSLKAIAQVHNTYILAEHPTGMWLVEQHIAHERVLYEQLCDRWQLLPLASPIVLHRLSPTQLLQLQRLELEVESFGEQMWLVRNAPAMLHVRDDCAEALIELSWGGDLQSAQVAVACRSAIRNGTALTLEQMQTLLDEWQRTRNPRTCPHGRPIYLSLEESALSRFFRRHWVIGKSHGI